MSDDPLIIPDPASLERGALRYFPVVPGRMEFAAAVRERLLRERPRVVAVELPASLESAYLDAVARLPEMSAIVYREEADDDETAVYIPVEPADPFTEAVRTAREIGAEVIFIDALNGERPHLPGAYPDTYALRFIGLDAYVEAYRLHPQPRTADTEGLAAAIAWKLQGADPDAQTLVVVSLNLLDAVLDAMQTPRDEPAPVRRRDVKLLNLHPECLAEVTLEYPYLQQRYEEFRAGMGDWKQIDRRRVQLGVYREAEANYELNTGDKVAHWQRRLLARFTRNLAAVSGQISAGLFDITVAARSLVDDNFAWEVWETAGLYPRQQTESERPTVSISGDEVWLETKKIQLRRRLPSLKRRLRPAGLRPRKKEKEPGEWARELDGNNICSYPPEDLVIEDYGRYLKNKGKSILSEEQTRVEPFTTSLLDGVDIRETIRNWHEKRIYVRSARKVSGEVGSVVVIFDEDPGNRYDYCTTWLGEHQNESDMAFYATHPFQHLVGPGIGRAEYGGFLMSLPARRMYDVWRDPDYDAAETKPERLLLAGLDYSIHRFVVYVAAKPPRSIFQNLAGRFGRTLVYIPIGQLSPISINKIRVVHVLDGYDKREKANEYLW